MKKFIGILAVAALILGLGATVARADGGTTSYTVDSTFSSTTTLTPFSARVSRSRLASTCLLPALAAHSAAASAKTPWLTTPSAALRSQTCRLPSSMLPAVSMDCLIS